MAPMMDNAWIRKYYKLLLVPATFMIYYFLVYLVNPYSDYWKFENRTPYDLAVEFSAIGLLCYLMVESCLFVSKKLNDFIPWETKPLQRGITQITALLAVTLLTQYIIGSIIVYIFFRDHIPMLRVKPTVLQQLDRWRYFIVSIGMTGMMNSAMSARYFLSRWRGSMIEAAELKLHAAELKEIAMQAELQSLKLQLDPHFMFNNFSTLSELISENQDLAQQFIDHLSKVYRYMILNIHHNLISLSKELRFIRSYIYLITIRHGDNVTITIEVPDDMLEKLIPPITLQLLIENAIKHNIATETHPLKISIGIHEENLEVVNNLQRIAHTGQSTRIGLKNIKERYRIVSGRSPEVIESGEQFRVVLPLLD